MSSRKRTSDIAVLQNSAKTLLANLRFSGIDNPIKSIVVTSSVPNEGKSTVACALAQAAASSGKRILIMECDMRRRSLAHQLGVQPRAGLYAVLSEQVPLEQAITATRYPNLYFLDAEPSIPNPPDVIASNRFTRLLDTLENAYNYVIIDTPPVGTFVDAAVLASHADATVFVVREGFVKRNEVIAAFEQLKKAGANVIGAVQNYCETSHSSGYYYEYYGADAKGQEAQASKAPNTANHSSHAHGRSQRGTRFK